MPSWHLPRPLLREVRRAGPVSPGVSNLVSPREALGSLQAPTAALLWFTFRLVRYGDPTNTKANITFKVGFPSLKILPTVQPNRTHLEKEEACQKRLSFSFSDRGQTRRGQSRWQGYLWNWFHAEERVESKGNIPAIKTKTWRCVHVAQIRFTSPFVYLYWNISREREAILNLGGVRHPY